MGVVVTRKPGGISQLYNTETGRVTFKCKSDSAVMLIEAFDGIVKFNKKGAIAVVNGHITSLDSCDLIKETDAYYKDALKKIIQDHKDFAAEQQKLMEAEIQTLVDKLASI
ncbi:MAG: MmcQ/YjbR family DNA-binding protein [Nitrosopumilaceae archaeon]|nr:MmcQ/YjbR family DNA-binding protein [Nitrosopumilaceae archaeon]